MPLGRLTTFGNIWLLVSSIMWNPIWSTKKCPPTQSKGICSVCKLPGKHATIWISINFSHKIRYSCLKKGYFFSRHLSLLTFSHSSRSHPRALIGASCKIWQSWPVFTGEHRCPHAEVERKMRHLTCFYHSCIYVCIFGFFQDVSCTGFINCFGFP